MPTKPSPGARADERADAEFAEIPGKGVAAGASKLIDDHHLGSVNCLGGIEDNGSPSRVVTKS